MQEINRRLVADTEYLKDSKAKEDREIEEEKGLMTQMRDRNLVAR